MSHHINLVRIKGIANALGTLRNDIVFVGGATVSLYADKPEQADIRPTDDIDVLIEIATYGAYTELQAQLAQLGFAIDQGSKVICRYKYQGLTVDIMPTDEAVLGFTNAWYKEGFENSISYNVDAHVQVNIFSAPYFIASKLEAFKGRGNKDGRTSQDFEDIIFVLDNRRAIWHELAQATAELKAYLQEELSSLLANPHLEEWITAHMEYQTATARARMIIEGMKELV